MITTILISLVSAHLTEVVSFINKFLTGTPFRGRAAFLIAGAMALGLALVKESLAPGGITLANLGTTFTAVFALSQVYFQLVMQTFPSLKVSA